MLKSCKLEAQKTNIILIFLNSSIHCSRINFIVGIKNKYVHKIKSNLKQAIAVTHIRIYPSTQKYIQWSHVHAICNIS